MGEIFDTIMIVGFVAILAVFIIGFNGQMMTKHKKRLEEDERRTKENNKLKDENNIKDNIDD